MASQRFPQPQSGSRTFAAARSSAYTRPFSTPTCVSEASVSPRSQPRQHHRTLWRHPQEAAVLKLDLRLPILPRHHPRTLHQLHIQLRRIVARVVRPLHRHITLKEMTAAPRVPAPHPPPTRLARADRQTPAPPTPQRTPAQRPPSSHHENPPIPATALPVHAPLSG